MSSPIVQNYPRAFSLMLASTVSFSIMAALIKLYNNYPLSQALFIRGAVALTAVVVVLYFKGQLNQIRTSRLSAHLTRATFGLMAVVCTFYALRVLQIADASAFFRSKSIFIIPLAYLILGERFNRSRVLMTGLGFLGVLIMLNPTSPQINLGTIAGLLAAFLSACAMITVRNLGSTEGTQTIVFYFMLIATLATAPFAYNSWINIHSLSDGFGLLMLGLSGLIGQYFMVAAYRCAQASFVGSLDYFTLLWSTLLGFIFWHEVPGVWVVCGALLVVASQLANRHFAFAVTRPNT